MTEHVSILAYENLRANLEDATWVGVDIDGITLNVEIVEKTTAQMEAKYQNGDILTSKAGVITNYRSRKNYRPRVN